MLLEQTTVGLPNLRLILHSCLLTSLIAYLINLAWKRYKFIKEIGKIPSIPGALPIIGNLWQMPWNLNDGYVWLQKSFDLYAKDGILCCWFGPKPMVFLITPENIEPFFNSTKNLKKSVEYDFLKPWLGTGLITSGGSKWHQRRKLITPTFHFSLLENYLQIMNEEAQTLVKNLNRETGKPEGFNMYKYISLCTLDVICRAAMGVSIRAQEMENSDYVYAVKRITAIANSRTTGIFRRSEWLFNLLPIAKEQKRLLNILHGFSKKVIEDRQSAIKRKDSSEQGKTRKALLDLLLEASEGGTILSNEDIREEVDTFIFAGHDTTASALIWFLFSVGHRMDIQEKIFEEVDSIFGNSDRQATLEDLKNMVYLERVIKESLRWLPTIPVIVRELQEPLKVGKYEFAAGVNVGTSIHALHRGKNQILDFEQFDPDNFLPEKCVGRHPFAYVPFSAGIRNCIGQKFALMEEKTVLSSIFRKFKVSTLTSVNKVRMRHDIVLKPEGELRISLTRREDLSNIPRNVH